MSVGDFRWEYDLAASFIELRDLRLRPGLINFVYELFAKFQIVFDEAGR